MDEYREYEDMILAGEDTSGFVFSGKVDKLPDNFKEWINKNEDKIAISGYKGTTPYFLLDNDKYVHLKNFQATKLQKFIVDSRREYLRHDVKIWNRDYFNRDNGGYLTVNKERIEHSKISKNEKVKFNKEYTMSKVFAQNGYKIEMLTEVSHVSSQDVTINGMKADLKCVSSHNNILKHAKKAIRKQGAEIVLFEFEKETKEIHIELLKLKKEGISVYYYFSKAKGKIYEQ